VVKNGWRCASAPSWAVIYLLSVNNHVSASGFMVNLPSLVRDIVGASRDGSSEVFSILFCGLFKMTFSVVLWIIVCQKMAAILKGDRHSIHSCLAPKEILKERGFKF
jgi:hypothetical protein